MDAEVPGRFQFVTAFLCSVSASSFLLLTLLTNSRPKSNCQMLGPKLVIACTKAKDSDRTLYELPLYSPTLVAGCRWILRLP